MFARRLALRYLVVWFAFVAHLTGFVAPGLSQLLSSPANAELCSTGPAVRPGLLLAGAVQRDDGQLPGSHADHACAYCHTHSWHGGMPLATQAALQIPLAHYDAPARFYTAPVRLYAWTSAQPRAPPQPAQAGSVV
ncbi:Protein of unknown function [Andreprevotia lacus DSM 23236]|jgi:hypothetical protein|uniref:DUF2946 domain-containing protein n=1 Tax=Andreprevotia lacus DSM 23236 TaxID=1121001 RepID=A0A1W1XK45_9NEIS|nr:DUF2946 domain-containing protein [Andreprevotia lacus]SMC24349.1 Protein of unknown function [Andreprevotia lacus DSM 23236]